MKKLLIVTLLLCFFNSKAQNKNVFDIARSGTLAEIQDLNKSNPDLINSLNESKTSPLILACYRGNIEVAKFLIENVKDINYTIKDKKEKTAFEYAVFSQNEQIINLLK